MSKDAFRNHTADRVGKKITAADDEYEPVKGLLMIDTTLKGKSSIQKITDNGTHTIT